MNRQVHKRAPENQTNIKIKLNLKILLFFSN